MIAAIDSENMFSKKTTAALLRNRVPELILKRRAAVMIDSFPDLQVDDPNFF
jgi:hypothetical protein